MRKQHGAMGTILLGRLMVLFAREAEKLLTYLVSCSIYKLVSKHGRESKPGFKSMCLSAYRRAVPFDWPLLACKRYPQGV